MKYRAVITLEFDAFDCPELRQRARELAEWTDAFDRRFGPASLVIRERRPRRGPRASAPAQVWPGP